MWEEILVESGSNGPATISAAGFVIGLSVFLLVIAFVLHLREEWLKRGEK